MRADQVNETCRNLEFDFLFLEYVKKCRDRLGKKEGAFRNGVIFQQVLAFKSICTLPDNSLETDHIKDRFHKFFGESISQPALARALHSLDKLGLIEWTHNPFIKIRSKDVSDNRQLAVKLTKSGKKMQYLLTGSTKAYPQIETAITSFRHHANVHNRRS